MNKQPPEEPLLIRSHHLTQLLQLGTAVPFDEQGNEVLFQEASLKNYIKFIRYEHQSLDGWAQVPNGSVYDPNYRKRKTDYIGENGEWLDQYCNIVYDFYREILLLDKDRLVRIQSNIRDGICRACFQGDHCEEEVSETNYITLFKQCAKEAGVMDELHVIEQGAQTYLDTSAGTLRQVLKFVLREKFKDEEDVIRAWERKANDV